jgi:transcriptional regulator of acetoin/glycerol metabolism
METGMGITLGVIIDKARRDENLPGTGLPTLGAMVDAYVGHILDATSHNVARSARILAIARSTLYHHLSARRIPPQ